MSFKSLLDNALDYYRYTPVQRGEHTGFVPCYFSRVWNVVVLDVKFLAVTFFAWVALYAVFAVGWIYFPNWLFLHYDGALTSLQSRLMLDWAKPFDVEPFNPFNAMGGSFLSINPWLNPGSIALSWFDKWQHYEAASVSVFWAMIGASGYVMFRALRLSPLYATLAVFAGLCLIFPLAAVRLYQYPQQAVVPIFGMAIVLLILMTAVYLRIGRSSPRADLGWTAILLVLMIWSYYAMPMSVLAFSQTYVFLLLGITIVEGGRGLRLRRIAHAVAALVVFYVLGFTEYIEILLSSAARTYDLGGYPPLSMFADWSILDVCSYHPSGEAPGAFSLIGWQCRERLGQIPQYIAVSAALWALFFSRGVLRILAVGFLGAYAWAYAHMYLSHVNWWDTRTSGRGHLTFIMTPMMQFMGAFAAVGILHVTCSWAVPALMGLYRIPGGEWIRRNLSATTERSSYIVAMILLARFVGAVAYSARSEINAFAERQHPVPVFPHASETQSQIVHYLEEEIALEPGSRYLGSAATPFGSAESPVTQELGQLAVWMGLNQQMQVWNYYYTHFGTRFFGTDLNNFRIPTLEDYNQFTPPMFFGLAGHLLSNRGDQLYPNYTLVSKFDPRHLQAFWVRFVISDKRIDDPTVRLRMTESKEGVHPVRLYELDDPNIGQYSPTAQIVRNSAAKIFEVLQSEIFDPRRDIVLQKLVDAELVSADSGAIYFVPGGVRVQARSSGRSLLLLPVNFSNCWKVSSPANAPVRLHRGNLVHLTVEFEDEIDLVLERHFNVFSMGCRSQDAIDQKNLDDTFFHVNRQMRIN